MDVAARRSIQGKSMFGAQSLSSRRTAPSHGFGSATRRHQEKTYMGPVHAKTSSISCTPGPCYEVGSSVGAQSDGGKTSPPMWQFGTAERLNGSPRAGSPGPGTYESASTFGKMASSNHSSFPRYGFGTVDRDMADKVFISPGHAASKYGQGSPGPAAGYNQGTGLTGPKYGFGTDDRFNRLSRQLGDASELPGPGSYDDTGTLGAQRSSRMATTPAFGFGSSNRDHSSRVFVSNLHAKASGRVASPGPAVYSLASSIGTQSTTRGRSAPGWGFGRDSRFKNSTYETFSPGPGAYAT